MPHSGPASWNVTFPSSISIQTGSGDLPVIMIPSYPAFLRFNPKFPPQLDDAKRFVSGDKVEILNLLELGAPVPVSGPVVTTSGLSGENGRTSGPTVSDIILAAMIFPPRYSSRSWSVHG